MDAGKSVGQPAKSLPLWECGLKFNERAKTAVEIKVTPLVGVWIEISGNYGHGYRMGVTPLVGVWIEIDIASYGTSQVSGHSPCGSVD